MPALTGVDKNGQVSQVRVDGLGRLVTRADTETDIQHANGEGLGYIFHSTYSATGGEESLYLQNIGENIHVARIVVSTSASGIFQIFRRTSGTAAGTTITGKNSILGRPIMPDVVAFGDASVTGSVDGDVIAGHDIGTSTPYTFDLDDIILPDTEAIAIRPVTTGVVHIELHCFRES